MIKLAIELGPTLVQRSILCMWQNFSFRREKASRHNKDGRWMQFLSPKTWQKKERKCIIFTANGRRSSFLQLWKKPDIYNTVKEFLVQTKITIGKAGSSDYRQGSVYDRPTHRFHLSLRRWPRLPKMSPLRLHHPSAGIMGKSNQLWVLDDSRCENHKQISLKSETAQDFEGAFGGDVSWICWHATT